MVGVEFADGISVYLGLIVIVTIPYLPFCTNCLICTGNTYSCKVEESYFVRGRDGMKQLYRAATFLRQIQIFPLSLLNLSRGKRLIIVALSYGIGIIGLWFLFPLVHNGASMFLPIMSACWLFRYRGLLISLVLNGLAFQLTYTFLLRGMLPDQSFIEGGVLGFGTSLGLGLMVCWLRSAVDLVDRAH